MKHSPFVRLWQKVSLWSITAEGEIVWWCSDDIRLRKRKVDVQIRVPRALWRPYCWVRGRHEEYYGACVFCDKPMKVKR